MAVYPFRFSPRRRIVPIRAGGQPVGLQVGFGPVLNRRFWESRQQARGWKVTRVSNAGI